MRLVRTAVLGLAPYDAVVISRARVPGERVGPMVRRLAVTALAAAAAIGGAGTAVPAYRDAAVATTIDVAPVQVFDVLFDVHEMTVPVAAGTEWAEWRTTEEEVVNSPELWKRLHLAQWDSVPDPLRSRGLDRMFSAYGEVLSNPHRWDVMTPHDWDAVPQPMRIAAFRRMLAYWAGYYQLGATYGVPPGLVSDTLAAIVMSESWFDHRVIVVNPYGNRDIGLAQASDYARERIRELFAAGRVDVSLDDDEYFNPWMATRFVAVWMGLLLDEANGDLPTAVRAYHRGIRNANDALGVAYGETVRQRLMRYIRSEGAPDSWDYFWHRSEALAREQWPWLARR